jgi:putative zinc finger/helix-turn-helix YgiT family protein
MGNQDGVISFPDRKDLLCAACGKGVLGTRIEETSFVYGTGSTAVNLTCPLPVHECTACGFEFTDDEAEDARDLAVRRYLQVMEPGQIREIRESYGASRREFGSITRIGEASLARWESGEVIQNAGYDQFLYLLKFPENFERLRNRQQGAAATMQSDLISHLQVRFPAIRNIDQTVLTAKDWQLRKVG